MKIKYLVLLYSVFSFFIFSQAVEATSGACSDHGGVNCSAGWTGSSVSYTSMQECVNTAICTVSDMSNLEQKYGVSDKEAQLNADTAQLQTIANQLRNVFQDTQRQVSQSGGIVSESQLLADVSSKKDALNQQKNGIEEDGNQISAELTLLASQINTDCATLGQSELITSVNQTVAKNASASSVVPVAQTNSADQSSNPSIVTQPKSQAHCTATWGDHTHPSVGGMLAGCTCDTGYVWSTPKDSCIVAATANTVDTSSATTANSSVAPAPIPTPPSVTQTPHIPWYKKLFNFITHLKFW
jgi:hypothetical protein